MARGKVISSCLLRSRCPSLCVALVGGGLASYWFCSWSNGPGERVPSQEKDLIALVRQVMDTPESALGERMEAATVLAQRDDAAAWIVLFLLDDEALSAERPAGIRPEQWELLQRQLVCFDTAVRARIIESIRAPAEDPVLWAVSTRLGDARVGEYNRRTGIPPFVKIATCRTDAIRDLARATLARCFGVDCGYDGEAWRRALRRRRRTGRTDPKPSTQSRPSDQPGGSGRKHQGLPG